MATRSDAALARVLKAREGVATETDRLEAAGRAAIDIPARIRRSPGKVIGVAAGGAFLLAGGPRRVIGGVRRKVFGRPAELPPSMLPEEIDKALRMLGSDGDKVRGTLEREFGNYLEKTMPHRKAGNVTSTVTSLARAVALPVAVQGGRRLADRVFSPDAVGFGEQLERIRQRVADTKPKSDESPPEEPPAGT